MSSNADAGPPHIDGHETGDGHSGSPDRAGEQPLVRDRNLEKQFDRGDSLLDRLFGDTTEPVRAIDGISFDIHEGETPAAAPEQPPTEPTVDAGDIDPVE